MNLLERLQAEQPLLHRRFGVRRIGLFGSQARGAAHVGSDVDLLVEFEEEASTYDNLLALRDHLRQTLDCEVDLVTLEGLSPHVRPYVEADLQWA